MVCSTVKSPEKMTMSASLPGAIPPFFASPNSLAWFTRAHLDGIRYTAAGICHDVLEGILEFQHAACQVPRFQAGLLILDDDFLAAQFTDTVAHPLCTHRVGDQFDAVSTFLLEGYFHHFRVDMEAVHNHFHIDIFLQEGMPGHTRFTVMETSLRIIEMGDVEAFDCFNCGSDGIRMADRQNDAVVCAILFEGRGIARFRCIGYQTESNHQSPAIVSSLPHQESLYALPVVHL